MTYLIIFAKLLASSAMLLAFYQLVLKSRASYKLMRLYLIMIPFVSIMMSGFTLEVYKPEPTIVELEQEAIMVHGKPYPVSVEGQETQAPKESITKQVNVFAESGYINYAKLGILTVSAILLLIMSYYLIKVCLISRKMKTEITDDGFKIIRSKDVKTPFSFHETIFMPANMEIEKERLILMHEKAHITNKHYIDVWIIEVMARLLWFNPIMWVVRNKLRNVHEYEADRCVIDAGANILRYQTILLEEVAEDSVIVANGFNHSFIRRRFLEMKNSTAGTLGKLGKVSTGIWVLLMFCSFTFTIGEAETIYNNKWKTPKLHSLESKEEVSAVIESDNLNAEEDTPEEDDDKSTKPTNSTTEYEAKMEVVEYASDGNPKYYELPANTNSRIPYEGLTIQRNANNTIVTVVGTPESDDEYFWFGGEQTYIEDLETGDHYKARRPLNMPVFTGFHAIDMKGKTFALKMEFPPLPDDVKIVRMWHLCSWLKYKLYSPIKIKDYEVK